MKPKIIIIIALAISGLIYFTSRPSTTTPTSPSPEPTAVTNTDIEAHFAIFTNGTFRIFTASMYHNLSPDAYIEASNPNLIKIKKSGTTWNDFFTTLPFKLTSECLTTGTGQTFCTGKQGTLKFYLNGTQMTDALSQVINHGDKLLVTFGSESEAQIQEQLKQIP